MSVRRGGHARAGSTAGPSCSIRLRTFDYPCRAGGHSRPAQDAAGPVVDLGVFAGTAASDGAELTSRVVGGPPHMPVWTEDRCTGILELRRLILSSGSGRGLPPSTWSGRVELARRCCGPATCGQSDRIGMGWAPDLGDGAPTIMHSARASSLSVSRPRHSTSTAQRVGRLPARAPGRHGHPY